MSYIVPQERGRFDSIVDELVEALTPVKYGRHFHIGELNYVVSSIIWKLWAQDVKSGYATANCIVGVLECIKQEFYRRQVAPYEDVACERNGDLETKPGGGQ
jgi:hypothetical protein